LNDSLPHEQLISKVKESYACLLPSLSEVSPNFGLECLRLRKPLIITRETGLNSIFEGRAKRVDPLNSDDIMSAIIEMIKADNYAALCPEPGGEDLSRAWSDVAAESLNIINEYVLDKR